MSYALFISLEDLKKNTNLNGNIEADKLLPSLKTAQQLELEPVLGTDLYNKISDDIIAGTLTGNYLALKQNYIHDVLIHFAMSYYLPFAAYTIANSGVTKHNAENTVSVENEELLLMINKEKAIAETYKKRLIKYLENNTSLFPEYLTNSGIDISPVKHTNRTSWNLNRSRYNNPYDDECDRGFWGIKKY